MLRNVSATLVQTKDGRLDYIGLTYGLVELGSSCCLLKNEEVERCFGNWISDQVIRLTDESNLCLLVNYLNTAGYEPVANHVWFKKVSVESPPPRRATIRITAG